MFFEITLPKYILYKKAKYYQDLKNILDWYILDPEYMYNSKIITSSNLLKKKKGVRENQLRITTDFGNMLRV